MRRKFAKKIVSLIVATSMMVGSLLNGNIVANARYTHSGWNINIYMCGSDLESDRAEASADLVEIMRAKNVPANVDIVIQTGGSKQWYYEETIKDYYRNELGMKDETIEKIPIKNISNEYVQRYRVKYDNYIYQDGVRIQYPSLQCISENEGISDPQKAEELGVEVSGMGEEATLKDFIKDVDSTYEHNVLVFWNHGSGTVGGVCVDDYTEDSLSLVEIDHVLTETEGSIPYGKYDAIGYDACLMSTFETMVVTARHANYMAASMTVEAGAGWYYTPIVESVAKGAANYGEYTGADFTKAVCEAYNAYYLSAEAEEFGRFDPNAYMGAYDLSKIRPMIDEFDSMAWAMTLIRNDVELNKSFEKAAYSATGIDKDTDLVGMYSFLKKTIAATVKLEKEYRAKADPKSIDRVEILNQYNEAACALKESMFEKDFCLQLVKGAPDGMYPDEEGISFYYPRKDSYDNGNYARYDYDKLGISLYYQAYAYSVAQNISRAQEEKATTSLCYNKKTGKYTFKLLSDNMEYMVFWGQKGYVKQNGKYRLVRFCDQKPHKKTAYLKPITQYPTFNGQPTFVGEKDPVYKDYEFIACVNKEEYTTMYLYKKKGKFYAFADYELKAGDVITPIKIEDSVYKPDKKASYKIKKKDINKEGDVRLPIKMVNNKDKKMQCTFVAMNMAGIETKRTLFHEDVVAFANAKASISRKTYKATGRRICPKVTVKMGKKTLKRGNDYRITYVNNIGAGTATVTVTGIGKYRYAAPKTLHYKILVNTNRSVDRMDTKGV